jgi:poly-beta-1,6-N-acetyl-D-glucosamine biosynthesis protein PgaD
VRIIADVRLGGLVIALLWIFWSLLRKFSKPSAANATLVVDSQQLCSYFQIDAEQLALGKAAKLVTVSFDDNGRIKAIREG